jgi:L-alanine-DL-glutamate epimerase-like enolase superfamily enzyme
MTSRGSWPAIVTPLDLTVKKIEKTWINVPFRPVPARNMIRELPHWTVFVIYKVTLACGVVGFGETMQFYTWGTVSEEAIARVMEREAAPGAIIDLHDGWPRVTSSAASSSTTAPMRSRAPASHKL